MEVENRRDIFRLCKEFRKKFGTDKKLWLYTGYYLEDLVQQDDAFNIIYLLDVMVDSPFELDKKVVDLKYRGSTNQRIIDIQKTLKNNNTIVNLELK